MNFLDFEYRPEPQVVREQFAAYYEFLRANRAAFSESAFEFAVAEWHYDTRDPRCPHDAWLESLRICDDRDRTSVKKDGIEIEMILLGAYHDGRIRLFYDGVKGYNLGIIPDNFEVKHHGDWLIDEIRISERGNLVHEINFILGGTWQIECSDLKFEWIPFDKE